jgi:hypothetical protein
MSGRIKEWAGEPKAIIVNSFELLGHEYFWEIVLKCSNMNVMKGAVSFLNSLHKQLCPQLQSR